MKLIAYPLTSDPLPLRAASSKRPWMDATPEGFAYRCLPLTIANSHGWEVINPRGFAARWRGGVDPAQVEIAYDPKDPPTDGHNVKPLGHFGSAVLTFELPFLLETPPGWNLMVTGPINAPKDGVAPLTGVVETDWSPYTFTMNWIFTRADWTVYFAKDEAIAHIMPVRRSYLENWDPEIRSLDEKPDKKRQNDDWRESRGTFITALDDRQDWAVEEKWQKSYYRGLRPDGKAGAKDHQIKLRLAEFARPKR